MSPIARMLATGPCQCSDCTRDRAAHEAPDPLTGLDVTELHGDAAELAWMRVTDPNWIRMPPWKRTAWRDEQREREAAYRPSRPTRVST